MIIKKITKISLILFLMIIFSGCPQERKEYKILFNGEMMNNYVFIDSAHKLKYNVSGSYFLVNNILFSDVLFKIKNISNTRMYLKLMEAQFTYDNHYSEQMSDSVNMSLGVNEEKEITLSFQSQFLDNIINESQEVQVDFMFSWDSYEGKVYTEKSIFLITN